MARTAHGVHQRLRVRAQNCVEPRAQVTVVIPCYNYARYLRDAVGSVLTQRSVDVTTVIVDDASTDGSGRLAEELAASDHRIEVIHHLTNLGPVETFNQGLRSVRSEFVARLDADDMLTPGSLERAVAVARAYPSVGLVYGRPLHFSEDPPRPREVAHHWTIWPGLVWLEDRCRSAVNVITSPEVLMRRSVVDVVGGQRSLAHTHDMEMWLRMASYGDVAYVHGSDQAWHREHSTSLSKTAQSSGGLTILEGRRDAFMEVAKGPLPQSARFAQIALDALAKEALQRASYEIDRRREDPELTRKLVSFALKTCERAEEFPEWRALQRRLSSGDQWARRRPWLRFRPLVRIASDYRRERHWRQGGTYERR